MAGVFGCRGKCSVSGGVGHGKETVYGNIVGADPQ